MNLVYPSPCFYISNHFTSLLPHIGLFESKSKTSYKYLQYVGVFGVFLFLFLFFVFLGLFLWYMEVSQARGRIRATTASLHHSYSKGGSELDL